LGYDERRCWANCLRNWFPRFSTYVVPIQQRHRWTDRQTDDMRSQDRTLHYSASRGKKGSRAHVCNYRAVTLTSVICKFIEKLIRNAILDHTFDDFISDCLHEFPPGRSCTTQLLEVLDKWTEIFDNGHGVVQ